MPKMSLMLLLGTSECWLHKYRASSSNMALTNSFVNKNEFLRRAVVNWSLTFWQSYPKTNATKTHSHTWLWRIQIVKIYQYANINNMASFLRLTLEIKFHQRNSLLCSVLMSYLLWKNKKCIWQSQSLIMQIHELWLVLSWLGFWSMDSFHGKCQCILTERFIWV